MRDEQPRNAAEHGEHHRLGEKLHDHTPPPRTQREADGDLHAARRAAHQEKVRDVGAGDQQHHARDSE